MARYPEKPEEVFKDITADYVEVFGEDLLSILLYGSAAGGEYRPGRSDLNFLMVLTEAAIEHLDRAFKTVDRWRKRYVAVPLFVTETYVQSSLDVFPIEYLDMQRRHVTVYGPDVLEGLTFDPEHVRLQCEREIKGKLLLLREGFLETGGKARGLKELITQSLPAFAAIFKALLYLQGKEIPARKADVFKRGAEGLGLDSGLFEALASVREERDKPNEERLNRLVKDYLREVRKLAVIVDSQGG
ncbi:MAG: hypothetical protein PVG49_15480 [Desulfobacteraceae bacterium]|jgi:predicted nucleotidyltransferase